MRARYARAPPHRHFGCRQVCSESASRARPGSSAVRDDNARRRLCADGFVAEPVEGLHRPSNLPRWSTSTSRPGSRALARDARPAAGVPPSGPMSGASVLADEPRSPWGWRQHLLEDRHAVRMKRNPRDRLPSSAPTREPISKMVASAEFRPYLTRLLCWNPPSRPCDRSSRSHSSAGIAQASAPQHARSRVSPREGR
jgi:hypothetical protein